MTRRSNLFAPSDAAVDCLGVGQTDSVLVVYNDEQCAIAESLAAAAKSRARAATVLLPDFVAARRGAAD